MENVYINGNEVFSFDYNIEAQELITYDVYGRVIATFSMSNEQWDRLRAMPNTWNELAILFGDAKED